MQCANAGLQANGYRTLTSRPGHHQTMIQSLPRTVGLDGRTRVLLDSLRKQRNVIDYSGDMVSQGMADEALQQAEHLLQRVGDGPRWMLMRPMRFLKKSSTCCATCCTVSTTATF
jgi:hypothetical protein